MSELEDEIQRILDEEEEKMLKYLAYYEKLEGNYSGKIRINREYLNEIKDELRESPDAYPTKFAYLLGINPTEYNNKYPRAAMYENMKMRAYSLLYINTRKESGWYDEDIGFSIGLELIIKEFADNHPEWKKLIK